MHGLFLTLLQIGIVLILARLLGTLFRRIHQPQVIGEMVAGILLGPSLLGAVAPGAFAFLFPAESLEPLYTLSQVGLLFFMFLVGLELDGSMLRGQFRTAVVTSQVSIYVPFVLGVGLAFYLYPYLAEHGVPFLHFALFMGAAMSVTAFPVLSRILVERNLLHTRVGAVTIACAAVDDLSAWLILAGVIALVRADGAQEVLLTFAGTGVFIAVMALAVRPLLRRLEAYYHTRGRITMGVLAVALLVVLAAALVTEGLGVHALFGAFLAGTVMPKDHGFVRGLTEKLEGVTVVFFLPLFFAYTGLHTQIGLLDGWMLWLDAALIFLVAVAGKFGGSALAARATGLSWREASALGVLMNTRGLMELIILTIGLELGVIPPVLFAMMVLMALATTFMTTPLLEWIYPARAIRQETVGVGRPFTALIPVSLPSSGPELLRVATALAPPGPARYYAAHLARAEDQSLFAGPSNGPAHEPLTPLLQAASEASLPVRPLTFVSRDVGADLVATAAAKGADLVVMGWHKPVLRQSILGGVVDTVMRTASADVVVYVARRFKPWQRILVPFYEGLHDRGALDMARRLAAQSSAALTILHVRHPEHGHEVDDLPTAHPYEFSIVDEEGVRLVVVEHTDPAEAAAEEARQGYDLVVVGADEHWGLEPEPLGLRHEHLASATTASLLIIRKNREPARPSGSAGARRATPPPVLENGQRDRRPRAAQADAE